MSLHRCPQFLIDVVGFYACLYYYSCSSWVVLGLLCSISVVGRFGLCLHLLVLGRSSGSTLVGSTSFGSCHSLFLGRLVRGIRVVSTRCSSSSSFEFHRSWYLLDLDVGIVRIVSSSSSSSTLVRMSVHVVDCGRRVACLPGKCCCCGGWFALVV
jgi:hypothetical protein